MRMVRAFLVLGLAAFVCPPVLAGESNPLPPFAWPVNGKVVDDDDGRPCPARYEGIDILVPEGTEVRASLAGTVIYSGNGLRGFGNLILIRHDGGWVTVYGDNSELFVNRGEEVETGDVIAKSGRTGFVARPELHFEIRQGQWAWNPQKYLPLLKPQDPEMP
jgi:murein DD-endopeptidase MepM/ murein hydrolase activator NlpD